MWASQNEPRHTYRVCQHSPAVGSQGQEGQQVEHNSVDDAIYVVSGWNQHDKEDHKLCIEDQKPGNNGTGNATAVTDKPHGSHRTGMRRWDTLLRLAVFWLPLNVSEVVGGDKHHKLFCPYWHLEDSKEPRNLVLSSRQVDKNTFLK